MIPFFKKNTTKKTIDDLLKSPLDQPQIDLTECDDFENDLEVDDDILLDDFDE